MAFGLYVVGGLTALAGVLALIFGIRINEFSLGNTLIVAGTAGFVGGVLIAGLGAIAALLRRIADDLAHMNMAVPARPAIGGLPPTPEATLRVGNISAPVAPPPFGAPQPDGAPASPSGGNLFPARRDTPPPPSARPLGAPEPLVANEKPGAGSGPDFGRTAGAAAGLGAMGLGLAGAGAAAARSDRASPPPFVLDPERDARDSDDGADLRKNLVSSGRDEDVSPQQDHPQESDVHEDDEAGDDLFPLSKLDTTMRPSSAEPPPPPPRPDFAAPLAPPPGPPPLPELAASTPPSPRSFFDSVWPRRGAEKSAPPLQADVRRDLDDTAEDAKDDRAEEEEGDNDAFESRPTDYDDDLDAPARAMDEDETDELDESDVAPVTILKSGVIDEMAYTLYSDGSIEAELSQGTVRFASVAELRDYIENAS
jgi:hypothetical protein